MASVPDQSQYTSVFKLTGRQRLTAKRGIRNVGQFLVAEVTNPGQNESQQMFALCDRMDKECKHLLAFILTRICYFGREELTYIPYSSFNGQSLAAC